MKNNKRFNLFARTAAILSALIVIITATAIGLFYYIFSISEPEGLSLAHWPQDFTNSFSVWTTYENGNLTVKEKGLERLDEYGLWIQFIDESGEEIFSHNKPADYPIKYTASELMGLSASDYTNGYTVFINSLDDSDEKCSYIVGFPYDIGKHMLHYNGERVSRLSPLARLIIFLSFCVLVIAVLGYNFWLSRKLSKVTDGIRNVSLRSYTPLKEKGAFSEIYKALNNMDSDIRHADDIARETERVRREWITNITHDLKTPLSPIKGYAELLTSNDVLESENAKEYGEIILKNVIHTEKLIDDLKLTYQLDSGSMPYNPKEIKLTRYLKELIIDVVNDPIFANRHIEFESNTAGYAAMLDPDLFRRAVYNIIINALTHNSPQTKVVISTRLDAKDGVQISICDNGTGISEAELPDLFNRYYRGTSTKEKPEGSGLGLAIAKQIIMLHGGDITVNSKRGQGTEFIIILPEKRK